MMEARRYHKDVNVGIWFRHRLDIQTKGLELRHLNKPVHLWAPVLRRSKGKNF